MREANGVIDEISTSVACLFEGVNLVGLHVDDACTQLARSPIDWQSSYGTNSCSGDFGWVAFAPLLGVLLWVDDQMVRRVTLLPELSDERECEIWEGPKEEMRHQVP